MAAAGKLSRCRPLQAALAETTELLGAISVQAAASILSHPRKTCLELLEKQAERVAHESARVGVTMPMDLDTSATATIVGGFVDAYAKLVTACQLYTRFCGPLLAAQLQQAVRRIVEACGAQLAQWLVALGGECPAGAIQDFMVSSSKWKQASYGLVQERCALVSKLPKTDAACALRTVMQLAVILKDTLLELSECLPERPNLSAIEAVLRDEEDETDSGEEAAGTGAASEAAAAPHCDEESDEEELDAVAAEAAHRCSAIMRGLRAWAGACVKEVRAVTAASSAHLAALDEQVAAFDGKGAGTLTHAPAVVQLHAWLAEVEGGFTGLRGPLVDLGELASSSAEDVPGIQSTCAVLKDRLHTCGALLSFEAVAGEGWEVGPAPARTALGAVASDTGANALLVRLTSSIEDCSQFCAAVLTDDFDLLHSLCGPVATAA